MDTTGEPAKPLSAEEKKAILERAAAAAKALRDTNSPERERLKEIERQLRADADPDVLKALVDAERITREDMMTRINTRD